MSARPNPEGMFTASPPSDVVAGPHDDDVGAGGTHIVGDGSPGSGPEGGHGDDRGDTDHQPDQSERGTQGIRGEGCSGGPEREGRFHEMRSLRVPDENGRMSDQGVLRRG